MTTMTTGSVLDRFKNGLRRRMTKLVEKASEVSKSAEIKVKKLKRELGTIDERLAELDGEISSLHDELKALRSEAATKREVAAAGTRGPEIEIIEPPLARTRAADPASVNIKTTRERLVIGRVRAPGGLIAFMINDKEQTTGKDGMFRVKVPVDYPETPVHIVAIDAAGLRSSLSFVMKPDADPDPEPKREAPAAKLAGVSFGTFHALVIGNNDYKHLPDLRTAQRDAQAVAKLLETRYGFKTTLLLNANRYAILSTLNKLRAELSEDDNLLIYYAGHGELDRANDRGNWLPVDAEPESTANWISNIQITDVLNSMLVRQIMVVADSCYSGTLTRGAAR